MDSTEIVWHSAELGSTERFASRPTRGGREMAGLVVLPLDGAPGRVDYRVRIDPAWHTRALDVEVERAGERRRTALTVEAGAGPSGPRWLVDGRHDPVLDGCVDVDVSVTPATNTLVVRRLALRPGEERTVPVAWLDVPGLRVHRSEQTYACLAPGRWRFAIPGFAAELELDADGYVLRYGHDVWTARARTGR